uniref:SMI1/KNR4 family protein n=1 Tax=Burkholderia sp. Ac-20379 TaxID=2703900 RepID=UPI00197EFEE5
MTASDFSDDDLAALRAHGIVLFADRVIFDAQPPMPPEQIAAIQAQCDGPLPDALLALWRLTAGGSLDYQLSLPMNGNEEAISWTELFYNGSKGYHDLQGWIDHERELAETVAAERGRTWGGLLDVVPFGGFEYCDRVYVVTTPGAPDHGHVLAWKQGMPATWHGMMHADGLATVATDLHAAFRALQLDGDPLGPDAEAGAELLDYLEERRESHDLPDALADKLIAFYRRAMIDWRTPLADGTLLGQPRLVRVALRAAVDGDDAPLVAQLAAAGIPLDPVLAGSLNPVQYALRRQRFAAASALL